jgi:cell division septation protein DedD
MKEKYDLSLDNRQIVSLLISALVVLGAVFVLGVVVGKKLASDGKSAQAPNLLAALDQKATQMEQVHNEPALTFQESLTAKTPEQAAAATSAAVDPVAPKPAALKPPAPAAPLPVKKPAQARPAKSEPKRPELAPAKADGTELRAAFAKLDQPAGAWSLQVAASQNQAEAERQVARLKDRGYSPYIVVANLKNRGIWYRVRLGHFGSRDAAKAYLEDFKRETRMDAFVANGN